MDTHLMGVLGAFTCAKMNPEVLASDIKSSKLNGAKIFLEGVVCQVPKKPVAPFDYDRPNNKFKLKNVSKLNTFYTEHLTKWCDAFFSKGLFLDFVFLNQYHTQKQLKYSKFKRHFMVHNDVGVNYSSVNRLSSVKPIYDSWVSTKLPFQWLEWKASKEIDAKLAWSFKPANEFGEAMMLWFEETIRIISERWKANGKAGGILYTPYNEAIGEIVNGKTSQAASYGDRSEVFAFINNLFNKYGVTFNKKKTFRVHNILPSGGSSSEQNNVRANMFRSITRRYGANHGLGALHEMHVDHIGVLKQYVASIAAELNITEDMVLKNIVGDNDGSSLKGNLQAFSQDNKQLFQYCKHSNHLFEEAIDPNKQMFHPSKYHLNWEQVGETHLKMYE